MNRVESALNILKEFTENNIVEVEVGNAQHSVFSSVFGYDHAHTILINDLFWKNVSAEPAYAARTLIHELSHFVDVGPTEDIVYEDACEMLALDAPHYALINADSFSFFICT
jgi:hypothetical protein